MLRCCFRVFFVFPSCSLRILFMFSPSAPLGTWAAPWRLERASARVGQYWSGRYAKEMAPSDASNRNGAFALLRGPVLHHLRQFAAVADGVRVVAEVPHHLDQTLLGGGAGQRATRRGAEQALTRETERRVVFRRGPGEIAAF